MWETTILFEVHEKIIFTATGVLEGISLAERRRHRHIDAPVDSEREMSDFPRKNNPRFLEMGSATANP